ncbi:hypothetical protein K2X92_03695 [Candidatus Gracilibacteria bacterium]|nr:hypothetical protein [Candidatus Gracilibacteria bacterium]
MKKIFLFAFLCILAFTGQYLFAATSQDNLNSQNFMVNIGALDPLGGNHESSPGASGPEAFFSFIGGVTNILLVLIPILAGISLLIAGYIYIFSAGDSEKALRAKTIIKWNIVAIFVSLLSYAIIKTVASFFS